MNDNQRFILKPDFNNLQESRLNYKDILTYITIRSYYNSRFKYSFPSYKTIAKRAQVSVKFISESVKRLESAGFIEIWKIGKVRVKHCYTFSNFSDYQKIPFNLFEIADITSHEKAMLLLLREYCNEKLELSKSISEIAASSGLTYRTIHKQYKALILKGYISEHLIEDPSTKSLYRVIGLTEKIYWKFPTNFHPDYLKAKTIEPETDGMQIVNMVTDMIKNMVKHNSHG